MRMLVWVDVETTGLDPRTNELLEVGMIATDDELNELSRVSVLLQPRSTTRVLVKDVVERMHSDNGLWDDCRMRGVMQERAQSALCSWLKSYQAEGNGDSGLPVMAGSTVHFDRAWLKAKLPLVEAMFHYRNIDVSSLKELNRRWRFAEEWENDRKLHRALPDLEDSIAELRSYHDAIEQALSNIPIEQC